MSESDTVFNERDRRCTAVQLMSLPIQVMTKGPLPAPSKCKSGLPQIAGTCPGWWKQSVWLRIWSLVWFQVKAISCHHTSSKKVNSKVYLDVLKSVVFLWCNQVAGGRPWVWQQDSEPAHKSKETQKECNNFVSFLHWPPPPPTWTHWTASFGHTSRTWPPTTPKPAWSSPSAKYLPSSRRRLWKRHALSSGSVPRWWLRLKVATLNRYKLYWIDFFNKSFEIKL